MLREWVVEGGGLYGYFGEQGLPAGIQECLERFHRRWVDFLSRQFVPKWDCPKRSQNIKNGELRVENDFLHAFSCIAEHVEALRKP